MRRRLLFALSLLLLLPATTFAGSSSEAEDRGKLSLAWDAWESGLCEEAVGYLSEIRAGSPRAPEALRLRADCLTELGRYEEAASYLESSADEPPASRQDLLLDVYSSWSWYLTQGERYQEVEALAGRGLAALPGSWELEGMRAVGSFRRGLSRRQSTALRAEKFGIGEEYAVRAVRDRPEGRGWIRAYPWEGETPWTPEVTLEDWMPSFATRLREQGRALWFRISSERLNRAVIDEARRRGLKARRTAGGIALGSRGEEAVWDGGEWQFRAAAEGLGIQGAAILSVGEILRDLDARAEMVQWVQAHRGQLEIRREASVLRVRNASSGRSYALDPAAWASAYDLDSKEWSEFWSSLVTELERNPGPYRSFCGRPVVLRETLVKAGSAEEATAQVFEKGKGYSVVLLALCPLHQRYVTPSLLREWGVSPEEAWSRAREEAVDEAWDLAFHRGEAAGVPYLVLQGEGVSSLARRPDLLLGALEAVEGRGMRGASVSVWTPTVSSLVVVGSEASADVGRAATTQVLMGEQRRGGATERVGYRASIRLPSSGAGSFQVRPRE